MKPSRYNFIFEHNNQKFAFNSLTCALAKVNNDFLDILKAPKQNSSNAKSELINAMVTAGYIVADDFNEFQYLQLINSMGRFEKKTLSLTIAPTLECNFSCEYCFESHTKNIMSIEIQNEIYSWVKVAAQDKMNVNITWYGGEPLLAKSIIYEMSENMIKICKKNGVYYSAAMITNGYNLDNSTINELVKARITNIQVTLDGPAYIHNTRRYLKIQNEIDTFKVIVENIKNACKHNIKVSIRMNIDKTNEQYIKAFLEDIRANGLEGCKISLGQVRAYTDICSSILTNCLSIQDYSEKDIEFQTLLKKKMLNNLCDYPKTKTHYCCADSISSFVIDPIGDIYKCWNDIGDLHKKVGDVKHKENLLNINRAHADYIFWSPFRYKKCQHCNILPICMGGCPYEGLKHNQPDCEKWKYNLVNILRLKCESN